MKEEEHRERGLFGFRSPVGRARAFFLFFGVGGRSVSVRLVVVVVILDSGTRKKESFFVLSRQTVSDLFKPGRRAASVSLAQSGRQSQ